MFVRLIPLFLNYEFVVLDITNFISKWIDCHSHQKHITQDFIRDYSILKAFIFDSFKNA